jgi:hypothetical protein
MVACVLEGICKRDLTENKVSFDWIAPRFIEKMAGLGEQIGERLSVCSGSFSDNDCILHVVR